VVRFRVVRGGSGPSRGLSDRPSIITVMHGTVGTDGQLATTRPSADAGDLDHPAGLADRLAQAFLLSYREGNTRDAYRHDLAGWWRWCAEHELAPLEVRRVHVDAYARTLEQAGRAYATVRRHLAVLSSFYRYAVAEGVLAVNPLAHVQRPPADDTSTTLGLDRAEAVRFLDAAEAAGPRDHALACLLLLTGLRVTEALAADVDQLGTDRGHQVLAVTAKGGRRRLVPLAPRTTHALAEHLAGRTTGPLLLANDGGRLTRQQAARIVARLARRAGILKRISPHSLRHTAATLALGDGASLRVVQASLGHADPKTTVRYDRARRGLDDHITYRLAQYLAPEE
jgi:integrase/recombinase XerD